MQMEPTSADAGGPLQQWTALTEVTALIGQWRHSWLPRSR
jgi:hypothetical protein